MAERDGGWTVAMLDALPLDGLRRELIDGELFVTPGPSWRHQDVVLALATRLRDYLRVHRVGHVVVAPADIRFDDRTVVQPDLFVVPLVAGRAPRSFEEVERLLLVAEVLSPGSTRADRGDKRVLYLERGVSEYWVVDADAGLVERWRPNDVRPEIVVQMLAWSPPGAAQPFTLDLPDWFAELSG